MNDETNNILLSVLIMVDCTDLINSKLLATRCITFTVMANYNTITTGYCNFTAAMPMELL